MLRFFHSRSHKPFTPVQSLSYIHDSVIVCVCMCFSARMCCNLCRDLFLKNLFHGNKFFPCRGVCHGRSAPMTVYIENSGERERERERIWERERVARGRRLILSPWGVRRPGSGRTESPGVHRSGRASTPRGIAGGDGIGREAR